MDMQSLEDKEKSRKDRAKKAIALAMQSRWKEVVELNRSITLDFPQDMEAYNRLGKALSELGRNREAKEAFAAALKISPSNSIAKKNLERLERLGDEATSAGSGSGVTPQVFIEESGKAGVTSLMNVGPSKVLSKLAPGRPVVLALDRSGLKVNVEPKGEYVGQVEPRLASRLTRLIKGGNEYEANVTSVGENELKIIIREAYKHPSQAGIVSFPSKGSADNRVYLPNTLLGYEGGEDESEEAEPAAVKDWSDDDTEPGDDDAYSPAFHRIINTGGEVAKGEDEEF